MNCAQHPEVAATAFCRECGKPMCLECQRQAYGSVYCDVHLPHAAGAEPHPAQQAAPGAYVPYPPPPPPRPGAATPYSSSPYTATVHAGAPDESIHPGLALFLGLIPGVGAIYNGQYAKGLVHAVVFGLLVSAVANAHNVGMAALIGIMIAAWVFYMAFEAYHTARKRRYGVTVEEFSGQFDFHSGGGRVPTGAILLIGLGFILLLETTDIISIDDFGKYWPVGLIVFGVYMLYTRLHTGPGAGRSSNDAEARR